MARIEFTITHRNELLADGALVERFTSANAAADMAVRFAQDNDALYSIYYLGRAA